MIRKNNDKKVFVSGCYDLLHSGHVTFFKEAHQFGDVYVGIGSDSTIADLKGRQTVNSEQERLYMVKAVRYVKEAFINSGRGIMDFEAELRKLKPDYFVVNEEGFSPTKQQLCDELGIELKVLANASESCWKAIKKKDLDGFSSAFLDSFHAQIRMFPDMMNQEIENVINKYKQHTKAWKLAGAGGGGYLILVAEKPIKGAMRIKIRRKELGF